MPFNLGDSFPDFACETDEGHIDSIHKWMEDDWMLFFSHPADFTPVCTTELAAVAKASSAFSKLSVRLIALSVDSASSHGKWKEDIKAFAHVDSVDFPIIADEKRDLCTLLGMVDPDEKDSKGLPLTCRAVFLVDKTKRIRLIQLYPATTGRSIDELYRVTCSVVLTAETPVATPVNWYPSGDQVFVQPSVDMDSAKKMFGKVDVKEVPSGKEYLRLVNMPEKYEIEKKISETF